MPMNVLKSILSKPLEILYNLSFNTGVFPDAFKIANVTPVYKSGSRLLVSNYRPISLLSIFSKILEKLVHVRLMRFFDKHDSIYNKQFGFRPSHNTSHAILAWEFIMSGHVISSSVVLLVLFLSGCSLGKFTYRKFFLTTQSQSLEICVDGNLFSSLRRPDFAFWFALPWFPDAAIHFMNNGTDVVVNEGSLFFLLNWNDTNILPTVFAGPAYLGLQKPSFLTTRTRIRRHKCPCAYYSNSTASFHVPLVGDLVFKLNPGPEHQHKGSLSTEARNLSNGAINGNCRLPLSLCLFNSRSIKNKSADIFDYVCDCKADLFAITETWLNANDDAVRAELCPTSYKISDHPRIGRRGGGVALLYRNSLNVVKIDAGERKSFEFSEWTVQLPSSHDLRVVILYRPPYSDEHKVTTSTFFVEFCNYLESIVLSKEQLLIVGDFNIHVDVLDDNDSIKLLDLLESFGLQQHVSQATHTHGHTLDLIITRQTDQIIKTAPHVDRFISDHASILCSLHSIKPSLTVRSISYRKLKAINMESLNKELSTTGLCQAPPNDLEELVNCYNETLRSVLDKHAPLTTKTIVERARVPWFNEEIREARRQRRKAEKKWRASKLDSDFVIFKIKRNAATRLMSKARKEFYTDFINENSGNQKKLFRASKCLFNRAVDDGLPPNLDCGLFANDLGRYFVQKITTIRSRLDNESNNEGVLNQTTTPSIPAFESSFSEFNVLSEVDVKALIKNSSLKSCPLDPMPSKLVSQCEALLPVIEKMLNSSLQSGYFPVTWKEALVFPLLKKPGLDITFKNFRPVSNLPFVSKLAEKAVFNQIHGHMTTNNLYPATQSAYRKYHSTETALLRIKNDVLLSMNEQHVTILVLLDLSAAFDTIDHDIMLTTLSSKLGLCGTSLNWFSSYLRERSQRVSVRGCISEKLDLCFGVPQGSCLGPLLFTIYTSKLFDVISGHLPSVHCYADDTQLYLSFSPKHETGQFDAITAIEHCIEDIRKWMVEDKLLLNDDKTEFLLIGTKQQLAKVSINHITIGNTEIAPRSPVKNLGVWLDSNLSLNEHITKTCSAAFYWLYNIRRIRKYISKESTETLIHAFISSRIDYCNSLLFGLPEYQLHKLQRIQNAAARLIFQESKFCHITPLLQSLHWLPVKYRIDFKILLMTFKAIHRLAPPYISELISIKSESRYSLRINDNGILLNRNSFKSLATLGDRSFKVAAPKMWNNLPCFIRDILDISRFKGALKTFLFKQAFG